MENKHRWQVCRKINKDSNWNSPSWWPSPGKRATNQNNVATRSKAMHFFFNIFMRGQNWRALTPYTDGRNPAYNSNDGICNEAGNYLNPLSTNLLKLWSSILPRAKRATNRNNVATKRFVLKFYNCWCLTDCTSWCSVLLYLFACLIRLQIKICILPKLNNLFNFSLTFELINTCK